VCARLGDGSNLPGRRRFSDIDRALAKLLGESGKIGSNHNQLAAQNRTDETPT
jgi:hypothetical protein